MSCFLLFVTLISTFQNAELGWKTRLWARVVDITRRDSIGASTCEWTVSALGVIFQAVLYSVQCSDEP